MATERVSMRQLREILRQKLLLARSHREVAASVGVSSGRKATSRSPLSVKLKSCPTISFPLFFW